MILSEAISKINYVLRGIDDSAPVSGSEEWNYWVSTLNRKKDELYQDVTKRWPDTFEIRSFGTVEASETPSFDLDDDFLAPSNEVYILDPNGKRFPIPLLKPEEILPNQRVAYIAGNDPKTLYISEEIRSTERIVGGEIYVPGYYLPEDFTTQNATLICPDPNWLVMATAAELAFNDIIYEDRAEGINAKANNLFQLMVAKSRRGTYDNPRVTPYSVNRIRGARR